MNSRISPDTFGTRKIHHEAVMYLLRLCANLKVLHNAEQELRADPGTLEGWSTHRQEFEGCDDPIYRYGQYGRATMGERLKHSDLLLLANRIIGELKLRNVGAGLEMITIAQVNELERMALRVDCRKQVVFY